ncbi:hypothetical protein NC652_016172 [Populus alba x Populus x berolinensis]|nr:hypothetical protein NC652_016172 [Populus alba x Populus x berolinensis]
MERPLFQTAYSIQVKGQTSSCLCAAILSDTAKASGIKPEIAITIPKRHITRVEVSQLVPTS